MIAQGISIKIEESKKCGPWLYKYKIGPIRCPNEVLLLLLIIFNIIRREDRTRRGLNYFHVDSIRAGGLIGCMSSSEYLLSL